MRKYDERAEALLRAEEQAMGISQGRIETWKDLEALLSRQQGNVSCFFRDLRTGETFAFQENRIHPAASLIKLYLMAYLFFLSERGDLSLTDGVRLNKEDMAQSCGVLYYLREVETLSVRDLMELMIIVSDNSATNILLQLVGIENLQRFILEELGLQGTKIRRRMMDLDAGKRGMENETTAAETGALLERIYRGELVSQEASAAMLQILREQQFDDLIPYYLKEFLPEYSIAHKTGSLDGVVHDAAIIEDESTPFLLCMLGSEVSVPAYSRVMAFSALEIYGMLRAGASSGESEA